VASYLIEGGPSRTYAKTKALMHGDPVTFGRLLNLLAEMSVASLRAQITAGASAIQLFDSWVGAIAPQDYHDHVAGPTSRIFAGLADLAVPRIHFGVGTGELLDQMAAVGADVVGVDWRVPLDRARARIGPGRAVQGNLDPVICLSPWEVVEGQARRVLEAGAGAPGHIFNLGHGVLPETDPDVLARLVRLVHGED
jgi:uroporphyrinogen decarboxylase